MNTLWLKSKTSISQEYDTHNLYGHLENNMTRVAMDKLLKKRSLIITRSSWAGTGHVAGKWGGDNESSWKHLFMSISSMLSMNVFGIPFTGSDICGFLKDTTDELCTRWYQLGAFYPFARNHNELNAKPQEPWIFGDAFVARARSVLSERYALLPYYYTLFFRAHTQGGTVMRSLPFEFPTDSAPEINFLDRQFMVGSALMISPVLEQGSTSVNAYFPANEWYDYYRGSEVEGTGKWHRLNAPIDYIPVHIRGGHIVPRQGAALTTRDARKNPFNLLVALDGSLNAVGELYLDDGISLDSIDKKKYTLIQYQAKSGHLSSKVVHTGYAFESLILDTVRIYGAQNVCNVHVNRNPITQFRYDPQTQVMEVYDQSISLLSDITWSC
jgi:alpha-glucosidase (family GH31 glycosyl hydrolase)